MTVSIINDLLSLISLTILYNLASHILLGPESDAGKEKIARKKNIRWSAFWMQNNFIYVIVHNKHSPKLGAIGVRMPLYGAESLESSGFLVFSSLLLLEVIISHSMLNAQCSVFCFFSFVCVCEFFFKFHVRYVSISIFFFFFFFPLFYFSWDDVCSMLAAYFLTMI